MRSVGRRGPPRPHGEPVFKQPGGRFRLMRYFTVTSLLAFALVGSVLYFLQRGEESFFAKVQQAQLAHLHEAQARLSERQERSTRESLLVTHEAAHVTLTRVLANVLWQSDFAPFFERAAGLSPVPCRALPEGEARKGCFAHLGEQILALPGFDALDRRAHAAMQGSKVFKIKVFDLRGVTLYSSERKQVGEDKSDNRGWQLAASGTPASELTHRDRFSAFEGEVENRDLISSYVPVRAPGSGAVVAVFEIYSDVTSFLIQGREVTAAFSAMAADNQREVKAASQHYLDKVIESSDRFLLIIGGVLLLLYLALLVVVRYGQHVIDEQARARQLANEREERWHREKMASLATMAANVSHEVGNPLASITAAAQAIQLQKMRNHCDVCQPEQILTQAQRIAGMTRQICDFAAARRVTPELVDLNQMVKAVLDFMSFDQRFSALRVRFDPAPDLPALRLIPDHLNEVLMSVLQACAECPTHPEGLSGCLTVATRGGEETVSIRIGVACADPEGACGAHRPFLDSSFELVCRRIEGMGGTVEQSARAVEIHLPVAPLCTEPASLPG